MINKVRAYIYQHKMIERGDRVIVGVSGGADSMALLSVLHRLRDDLAIELVVAHLNHGLRGREADADAALVKSTAATAGLPYFDKNVDVDTLAKQNGLSLEDAARRERYAFFFNLLRQLPADKIATGHQMHDQAETVLLNLLRGTGSRGLRGIVPVRNQVLIRPFLEITREEILAFLERERIPYREDESNRSGIFRRNRIRHELLPHLKQYNPRIEERLHDLAEIMRVENDFQEGQTAAILEKWKMDKPTETLDVNIQEFLALHEALQRRVAKSILESRSQEQSGINQVHVDAVIRLFRDGHVGQKLSLPFATEVCRGYEKIAFRKNQQGRSPKVSLADQTGPIMSGPDGSIRKGFDYPINVLPADIFIQETGLHLRVSKTELGLHDLNLPGVSLLDFDRIQNPLRIRNFCPGDRFHPLGMAGTKKLKSFFIDKKIPREMRQGIPLLVDRRNILCIAGMAISDLAKVTPSTRICLKIEII